MNAEESTRDKADDASPPGRMTMPDGTECWKDGSGHWVPRDKINDKDQLCDDLVRRLFARAEKVHDDLISLKNNGFSDIDAYLQLLAEKYGEKRGGKRGGTAFTTYDGTMEIELAIHDKQKVGPEFTVAQKIIQNLIREWSGGAQPALVEFVNTALHQDNKGQISMAGIRRLKRMSHEDPRWHQAMKALDESIHVVGVKRYLRFRRNAESGESQTLHLALSKV